MLVPVNGGILIRKVKLEKKGSIILPDSYERGEPSIAEVIAISEDCVQGGVVRKMFVEVGDKVIYNPQFEVKFNVNGKEQILIMVTAVLAIIREEKE